MRALFVVAFATSLLAQTPGAKPVVLKPEISDARGLKDWVLDGSGGWSVRGSILSLDKAGVPGGPIRRPAAIAILQSEPVADFTLEVEARSTAPVDLAVRDVLLIFGYQSPTQFYYVHLAAKTDDVHNGVFVVNNADRKRLDDKTGTAKLTDQAWHRLRLERNVTTGSIRVFFGDDKTPIIQATDRTLVSGRVGVGSFDETGEFRAFELRGSRP
jgi:hypothetical protein